MLTDSGTHKVSSSGSAILVKSSKRTYLSTYVRIRNCGKRTYVYVRNFYCRFLQDAMSVSFRQRVKENLKFIREKGELMCGEISNLCVYLPVQLHCYRDVDFGALGSLKLHDGTSN